MKTKLAVLFGLHLFVLLYVACDPCVCPDPVDQKPFIKVNKISVMNVKDSPDSFNSSFSPQDQYYIGNTTNDFAIRVVSDYSFIASNTCRPNPFISSAMACDCVLINDGSRGLKFDLDKIVITPLQDYDVNYPAGSDMSKLFILSRNGIGFFGDFSSSNKITIDEYIVALLKAQANYKQNGFSLFIEHTKEFKDEVKKVDEKQISFNVKLYFSDNSVVEAETKKVSFRK